MSILIVDIDVFMAIPSPSSSAAVTCIVGSSAAKWGNDAVDGNDYNSDKLTLM